MQNSKQDRCQQAANDLENAADPEVRYKAVLLLEEFECTEYIDLIRSAVRRDPDYRVRMNSVTALTNLVPEDALETILPIAESDTDPQVREVAVANIGKLVNDKNKEAPLNILVRVLLTEADPDVREQAATALSHIRDSRSMSALKKAAINETDAGVHYMIGVATSKLGG